MKKLSVLVFVVFLSSCTSMQYGNFTVASPSNDAYLATDAASQLARVYPPARYTFRISQKICDGFGRHLIQAMRTKGYGVIENTHARKQANFFYVVDETERDHLYRVSLYVHHESLSRMYAKTHGKLAPISPWSHKESCR
ncbi:MAG: conjugal transfer protein TrbH [Legionella sp.]|nr:conjugal transfer protein TrbH [Legionella sp.]